MYLHRKAVHQQQKRGLCDRSRGQMHSGLRGRLLAQVLGNPLWSIIHFI
jgi:hypothetical protein